MEIKITDLFDDIPNVSFSISHCITASDERIKELTKNKIHDGHINNQQALVGRSIVKAILLAAVLVCLSFTAFAALSGAISSWPWNSPQEAKDYDNDLFIGSVSKTWDIGGWQIELQAESVGASGLTVVCSEWSSREQSGKLTSDDAYWLEKWNGNGYDVYLPEKVSKVSGNEFKIQPDTTVTFPIIWEERFGTLAPGFYRLGKIFRHTSDSGEGLDVSCYVKFRIFEEDNAFYYNQYEYALQSMRDQQNWHATLLVYPEDTVGYSLYTHEIIKCGESYWEDIRYLNADGAQLSHSSTALVNGIGYRLIQNDDNASSEMLRYQPDLTVQENIFLYWFTLLTLSDAHISEISRIENGILFKENIEGTSEVMETVLMLDENGQIKSIDQYRINAKEKELYCTLTVHDTDASQILKIMDSISP